MFIIKTDHLRTFTTLILSFRYSLTEKEMTNNTFAADIIYDVQNDFFEGITTNDMLIKSQMQAFSKCFPI